MTVSNTTITTALSPAPEAAPAKIDVAQLVAVIFRPSQLPLKTDPLYGASGVFSAIPQQTIVMQWLFTAIVSPGVYVQVEMSPGLNLVPKYKWLAVRGLPQVVAMGELDAIRVVEPQGSGAGILQFSETQLIGAVKTTARGSERQRNGLLDAVQSSEYLKQVRKETLEIPPAVDQAILDRIQTLEAPKQ